MAQCSLHPCTGPWPLLPLLAGRGGSTPPSDALRPCDVPLDTTTQLACCLPPPESLPATIIRMSIAQGIKPAHLLFWSEAPVVQLVLRGVRHVPLKLDGSMLLVFRHYMLNRLTVRRFLPRGSGEFRILQEVLPPQTASSPRLSAPTQAQLDPMQLRMMCLSTLLAALTGHWGRCCSSPSPVTAATRPLVVGAGTPKGRYSS